MSIVNCESQQKFQAQLQAEIERRLEGERASALIDFARRFHEEFPLEELEGRVISDVYGNAFGWWRAMQRDPSERAIVEVFNPTLEEDGWVCSGTVIRVIAKTAPFLLDSIRLALDREEIAIQLTHGASLHPVRAEDGRVVGWRDVDEGRCEMALHLEVIRHSSARARAALEARIRSVIEDVLLVVDDFQTMRARVGALAEEMRKRPPSAVWPESTDEAVRLLDWMLDDHFTFLGMTEVAIRNEGGVRHLTEEPTAKLGLLRKARRGRTSVPLRQLRPSQVGNLLDPELVGFAKSAIRSTVHRSAYSDYVTIKRFDEEGEVCGELRILGLYTSVVYRLDPLDIPVVRGRIQRVMERSGAHDHTFHGRHFQHVLETFPREELFLSNDEELLRAALGVMRMQERKRVRLFVRRDRHEKFISCLVYTPRDLYNTDLRRTIQDELQNWFAATETEFTTYFSESNLARTHFVFRVGEDGPPAYDVSAIEARVVSISRTWDEQLVDALVEAHGEEEGVRIGREFQGVFPASYMEDFEPRAAVADIRAIGELQGPDSIAMHFFRSVEEEKNRLRFKLFHPAQRMVLSDVIPVLENLGLQVSGEHPYSIRLSDGRIVWIHDFLLDYPHEIDLGHVREHFGPAFSAIWYGRAENDSFNRLILGTRLGWREVALLRAYARYLKQIGFHLSLRYIAETLSHHRSIAEDIVGLFRARFHPHVAERACADGSERAFVNRARIDRALDSVASLDEDRIIRRYVELIEATLRTSYFQRDQAGELRDYFAFKLDPGRISDIPLPRPAYEIFVYSPRVEGVHLRGGSVARGGLRWSDRQEDYRTEILGLVKAQQVKNAVIVPVGAKGGFVVKRPPSEGGRDALHAEGVSCYRTFISALLDLTDNLVAGEVVPPADVIRVDGDDPYLVVAADKGTATFSDIANAISIERGFWLGDAFASGGSVGYDHKKMGITARGAWVSVQRHFRERGIDVQSDDFTVVGIGDMSGDVFGNGMLLSEHIQLVAAFNHLHIFVDPDPDVAVSHAERARLFAMPRSSWMDYGADLISTGGGVFSRAAKSVAISPEMKARFDIGSDSLTPTELISALLKSPVDLIWNGGIGTYIKARSETHAEVGDKANDGLRVDAEDLRCQVLGEGGNLGATQRGRVAFCLAGGAANTDFIDNAAGVDCSDHEVNIKILLRDAMAAHLVHEEERAALLESMTEEVSELVLESNARQVQAISLAESQAGVRMGEYRRYISMLEESGRLDRALEFLPDEQGLVDRMAAGQTLTRPELALLISYSKAALKEALSRELAPDEPGLCEMIGRAFPEQLSRRFGEQMKSHRLRGEILATQLAGDIVNRVGFTFVDRLQESTGASTGQVARAYFAAREIFDLSSLWDEIEALDHRVPASVQLGWISDLCRLMRRGTRWVLRNRRGGFTPAEEIERFQGLVGEVARGLPMALRGARKARWQDRYREMVEQGCPEALAVRLAGSRDLHVAFGLVEAAEQAAEPLSRVADVYFELGESLELAWFFEQVFALHVDTHWQALAREAALDDLDWQQRALTVSVLGLAEPGEAATTVVARWQSRFSGCAQRWSQMLSELHGGGKPDFAMCSVALRELLDWSQASSYRAPPRSDD